MIEVKWRERDQTRSSWLNCASRDDEAVYWISIGHYEAVAVGNWWYWVSRGHSCLYILHKVEIWTGVTDAWLTDWQTTLKDRATQLLIKYKSGALVTQLILNMWEVFWTNSTKVLRDDYKWTQIVIYWFDGKHFSLLLGIIGSIAIRRHLLMLMYIVKHRNNS